MTTVSRPHCRVLSARTRGAKRPPCSVVPIFLTVRDILARLDNSLGLFRTLLGIRMPGRSLCAIGVLRQERIDRTAEQLRAYSIARFISLTLCWVSLCDSRTDRLRVPCSSGRVRRSASDLLMVQHTPSCPEGLARRLHGQEPFGRSSARRLQSTPAGRVRHALRWHGCSFSTTTRPMISSSPVGPSPRLNLGRLSVAGSFLPDSYPARSRRARRGLF
jgi:hypothetical protein